MLHNINVKNLITRINTNGLTPDSLDTVNALRSTPPGTVISNVQRVDVLIAAGKAIIEQRVPDGVIGDICGSLYLDAFARELFVTDSGLNPAKRLTALHAAVQFHQYSGSNEEYGKAARVILAFHGCTPRPVVALSEPPSGTARRLLKRLVCSIFPAPRA